MIWTALGFVARVLGPILPFLAVWVARGRLASLRGKNEALRGNIKTREKMDEAHHTSDPAIARERLRERDPDRR